MDLESADITVVLPTNYTVYISVVPGMSYYCIRLYMNYLCLAFSAFMLQAGDNIVHYCQPSLAHELSNEYVDSYTVITFEIANSFITEFHSSVVTSLLTAGSGESI